MMKTLGVLLFAALITPVVLAQADHPAPPPPEPLPAVQPLGPPPVSPAAPKAMPREPRIKLSDPELDELIETFMTARLSKELGLNDEQTVLMVRRFSELRDKVNEIRKQRQETIRELRAAAKAGKPDTEIQAQLNHLMALDQKAVDIRRDAYNEAGKDLNVVQRAKLYVFLSEFPNEMRRLAQTARERAQQLRGTPGGPGSDPGRLPGGPPQEATPPSGPHTPPPPPPQETQQAP